MSLLAFLCAYVTGVESKNVDITQVLKRAEEAAKCAYKQQLRRSPHTDVGETLESQPSLAERIRIAKVVDVIKDEKVAATRGTCWACSFCSAGEALEALGERDAVICQSTDQTQTLMMVVKRKKDWIVIETLSGAPCSVRTLHERHAARQVVADLLKTPNSRVACTYITRR